MEVLDGIYKEFLDNLKMNIFILDAAGNYLYVNPFYCKNTNKTEDFFLHTSIPELKKLGYFKESAYEQVCIHKRTVNAMITIKNDLSSTAYDTLITSIPTFDDNGNIRYIFCTQEPMDLITARIQNASLNRVSVDYGAEVVADAVKNIIAESTQMKQILSTIDTIAPTDVSILLSGPSGSGKEVLANYIHKKSSRTDGPLISLNCSAIPESLIESELFGYVKGAFTGASTSGKTGLIEAAEGGTLFLDEINSMPINMQVKLLRVLETGEVFPIGSSKAKKINFRLVCASNEDLLSLVNKGLFRLDLYYRINVFGIIIPPLCERKDDIIPLALYYANVFCKKYNSIHFLSGEVLSQLKNMSWKGNVRELKNYIERIIVTTPKEMIQITNLPDNNFEKHDIVDESLKDISAATASISPVASINLDAEDFSYRSYMDSCEKALLEKAIAEYGSPKEAAKVLKINVSNIYRKMQKHHME